MKNEKKLNFETIANVVVVLAIVVVTGIIVKKYLFDSNEPVQKIAVGQKLSIPGVDWNQNGKTIILAVKQDCTYCTASAPFFRQIADEAGKQNIKIEVVSSDSEEYSKNYLAGLDIAIPDVHQVSLRKYGFSGTPTLLFVNRDGTLKDMWMGGIDNQNSAMVLSKLKEFMSAATSDNQAFSTDGSEYSPVRNPIALADLKTLLDSQKDILMIDIDSRQDFRNLHIANAKNIPSDEILARASREIPKNKKIVFYGRCPRDSFSSYSQDQLFKLGYTDVSFLAGGLTAWKDAGFAVQKSPEISQ
jgi:rhodanese-related sulfurtransferase/peroxiredoxin